MITSHRNPLVKRIKKLRRKKHRQEEGAFFIEGIRVVLTALEQEAPVDTIVYAPSLLTSEVALAALAEQKAQGAKVVELAEDVFQTISDRDNPVGLGAIVNVHLQRLQDLPVHPDAVYIALERISDPGNLGAIVRTVDAAGGAGLILVGPSVDPFHPTAVKASMGALFTVPVAEVEDMDRLWRWIEAQGLHTVATSAHAERTFWETGYRFPTLLLLGSEGQGLQPETLQRAEVSVTIPMQGTASSLNLSVAAALLLYELRRYLILP
ncbi:MAG TPA: RNA methyltransferase [Candidatus Sulfomarinibacteraceae bacterium]|nr:RNA methyltransferase [Candidatus Sulfomarinibacteraceae bacterium]